MLYAKMQLNRLPEIGFAHHFRTEHYAQTHQNTGESVEIVYVKEGAFTAEIYGKTMLIQPGSVLVLVRTYPFRTYAMPGVVHAHCSVQLTLPFSCEIMEDSTVCDVDFPGLLLPVVVPPGPEAEGLRKELFALVAEVSAKRDAPPLSASIWGLNLLSYLDKVFRHNHGAPAASLMEYKIKRYIAEHMRDSLTLADIGAALNKTPNYLNGVFKKATGYSIRHYINRERVRLITELMEVKGLSFKEACENVAIYDVSYGYRLFKQHMGVTTRAYLSGCLPEWTEEVQK